MLAGSDCAGHVATACKAAALLTGSQFVNNVGFGCVIPVLPIFAAEIGLGPSGVGLILSSSAFSRLLLNVRGLVRWPGPGSGPGWATGSGPGWARRSTAMASTLFLTISHASLGSTPPRTRRVMRSARRSAHAYRILMGVCNLVL